MGGREGDREGAGDDGGIGDAQGYALCWNRKCKQVGFGDVGCHEGRKSNLRFSDGLKRRADSGGTCHVCRWLDSEFDVDKETAEERLPDEGWSAAAWRMVTVELNEMEERKDVLDLDCCDGLDG